MGKVLVCKFMMKLKNNFNLPHQRQKFVRHELSYYRRYARDIRVELMVLKKLVVSFPAIPPEYGTLGATSFGSFRLLGSFCLYLSHYPASSE